MLVYAHRGNLTGSISENENTIGQIKRALAKNVNVEVDVFYINDILYLGHDKPQEKIEKEFLKNNRILTHAKDIQTMFYLSQFREINSFIQKDENISVSTHGNVIVHQHYSFNLDWANSKTIMVDLNLNKYKTPNVGGIITDFAFPYGHTPKKPFKMIVCDVDGVLTSGKKIYNMTSGSCEYKEFLDRDFTAIKRFISAGVYFVLLSGDKGNASIAKNRALPFYSTKKSPQLDKSLVLSDIENDFNVDRKDMLYIGDDYYDISIMHEVGKSYCPADAAAITKRTANFTLNTKGGEGTIEELWEIFKHEFQQSYPWEPNGKMPTNR